jgi:hypothetical protein
MYGYVMHGDATAQTTNILIAAQEKGLDKWWTTRRPWPCRFSDLYSYGYYLWGNHERWIHTCYKNWKVILKEKVPILQDKSSLACREIF